MKKELQFLSFVAAIFLLASWNLYAQDYHYQEGFLVSGTPEGWSVKDVSYSNSSENTANTEDTAAHYCAKMKTNNGESWLQGPKVNSAGTLTFWCKVKDAALDPHVTIQTSPDGETWTDFAVDPAGIDLANDSTFQNVSIDINLSGPVIVRFFVTSTTPGTSGTGTLTVDDIHLTKPTPTADDVSLSDLTIGGNHVPGFDFSVTSYAVDVPFNVSNFEIAAVPNNPNATVSIVQVTKLYGTEAERTATVTVTGEDGIATASITILVTRSDYFWQEGFGDASTDILPGLSGWEASEIWLSTSNVPPGAPNIYPGGASLKFTGGHETGSTTVPGILLSPKIKNVDKLKFWVALQKQIGGESLTVRMKKGFALPTELWKMDDTELTVEWQEVIIEINETDSIQIEFSAVCDINDDAESRIWIDDLSISGLLTSTSIHSYQNGPSVSLYPNPAGKILNIMVPENAYQSVEVFNITGQKVIKEALEQGQSNLNIDNLTHGIYMISFTGKAGRYTSKFIKE